MGRRDRTCWNASLRSKALAVFAGVVGPAASLHAQVYFTDVSASSGFSGTRMYSRNFHGLGVTWLDVDNDGWDDLFVVNGKGYVKELYRNRCDGTFELRNDLLPPLQDVEFMGAVAGDYDNDGDVDLYVFTDHESSVRDGGPRDGPLNLLLKNQFVENGGDLGIRLFNEVAATAGVDDAAVPPLGTDYPGHRSAIGGFLDFDRDGFLDLYVGHWAMPAPNGDRANQDRLFRNAGDGTFDDVTADVGLPLAGDGRCRPTLGFIAAQLDDDLWPDLYVGHTGVGRADALDVLYFHDGVGGFVDTTADSPGLGDDATANMGVVAADVDNDGDFELYMSDLIFNFDPPCNPYYVNRGDSTFDDDQAAATGVVADDSWAVVFLDADQDGFQDLFVGTTLKAKRTNFFYVNAGDGTFQDESATSGVSFPGDTRGGAAADYDHDGDLDLCWVDAWTPTNAGGLKLLRNDTPSQGHWLEVDLTGTTSNRSAIGARLKARVGKTVFTRQVVGGSGAHGQDSLTVHFGLGSATAVDRLVIEWPSGAVNVLRHVAADQRLSIGEQVDTHLVLTVDPPAASEGETIEFQTSGGAPGELDLLAIVDVEGVPEFVIVDFGEFDSMGQRRHVATVPSEVAGIDVTFQAFGIEAWSGRAGGSELATVTLH